MTADPLFNVRFIKDLKDMLNQSVNLYGNRNAFYLKTNKNQDNYHGITYNQFKHEVDSLGTALIHLGLKDKYIAIISENRYEWCLSYLSIVNGTGVAVPLDKELPAVEIENLLNRSQASAIIFSGKMAEEIKKVASNTPHIQYYINMDLTQDENGMLSLPRLLEKGKKLLEAGDRSFIDCSIDDNALSVLLFTSGTTDLAKGVMLSHTNICSNIMAVCQSLHISCEDSALSILPLHHTYECTCGFLVMIYNGCRVSFLEGLKHIAKNLKETRPSILMMVPLILENVYSKVWEQAAKKRGKVAALKAAMAFSDMLYRDMNIDIRKKLFKQVHDTLGGNIRLVISGAAAIAPEVSKGFDSMGINVRQGYGLTEFSPIVAVNRDTVYRYDSIGLPLPGVEVKLENVNSEGIGELVVKGNSRMLGYFQNPEATAKVIQDGWLYTGDLGHMDASGFLYITGRKKNVIVTKNGKNIFPEEVEAYLNKSPYIKESMVWGKYEEASGETYVNAQIVPDMDYIKEKLKVIDIHSDEVHDIIHQEIKSVNKNMPHYKMIRGFTIRENEFAKTTTKKIKRYAEKVS